MKRFTHIGFMAALVSLAVIGGYVLAQDAGLIPIEKQELQETIRQTPLDNPKQYQFTTRAVASNLQKEAYEEYLVLWGKNPNDFYTNLRLGVAARYYYSKIGYPNPTMLSRKSPDVQEVAQVAIDRLKKAVELRPNSSEAHLEYGQFLYLPVGRTGDGVAHIEKALELEPKSPRANAILGDKIGYPGNTPEKLNKAEELKHKAIELDPTYAFPHLSLARQFAFMERFEEADQEMKAFLKLSPLEAKDYSWIQGTLKTIQTGLSKKQQGENK